MRTVIIISLIAMGVISKSFCVHACPDQNVIKNYVSPILDAGKDLEERSTVKTNESSWVISNFGGGVDNKPPVMNVALRNTLSREASLKEGKTICVYEIIYTHQKVSNYLYLSADKEDV